MEEACRSDWRTEQMPTLSQPLRLEEIYTAEEFSRIRQGLVPEAMEDKWFMFYEAPWFYLHRSWTGFCIYQVRFEPLHDGFEIAEVIVNRDLSQNLETDDERAAQLLKTLLDARASRDVRRQMKDYIHSLRQNDTE